MFSFDGDLEEFLCLLLFEFEFGLLSFNKYYLFKRTFWWKKNVFSFLVTYILSNAKWTFFTLIHYAS